MEPDPGLSRCHLPALCYSIGRAADLLRGDIQQQLRNIAGELSIRHLRLRNIFSDDLFVYYETPDKVPVYNWQYIDMIYDFLPGASHPTLYRTWFHAAYARFQTAVCQLATPAKYQFSTLSEKLEPSCGTLSGTSDPALWQTGSTDMEI